MNDPLAQELRGFGLISITVMLVALVLGNVQLGSLPAIPVGAVLVLLWAWRSGTPWKAIGYARPRNWWVTAAAGVALGVALKLSMKALVMPLLGAPAVNPRYHFLAGNTAMLPVAVWTMLVAGFGEETVFRGFLFERGTRLLGSGTRAKAAIVVTTSVLFGLAHFADQGLAGAEQGTITGLVFGAILAAKGQIFVPMIAHSAFDLTALALIYWELEERVAHLVFR